MFAGRNFNIHVAFDSEFFTNYSKIGTEYGEYVFLYNYSLSEYAFSSCIVVCNVMVNWALARIKEEQLEFMHNDFPLCLIQVNGNYLPCYKHENLYIDYYIHLAMLPCFNIVRWKTNRVMSYVWYL